MRLFIVWATEDWNKDNGTLIGVFADPKEASAVAAACAPYCHDFGSVWTEERTLGLPLFPVWGDQ